MTAVVVPAALPLKLRYVEPARAKQAAAAPARVLITVTVHGSAGPLRFLVDDGETVASVVRSALRCYAREGRRPVLGNDTDGFLLYCANGGSDALAPGEKVRFGGCRSFVLCRKPKEEVIVAVAPASSSESANKKGPTGWKTTLNKMLSFRV